MNLSFCARNQLERLTGVVNMPAPQALQSFRHHRPTARLESMTDPLAFFSCHQHDDYGTKGYFLKGGILVKLSHLKESE